VLVLVLVLVVLLLLLLPPNQRQGHRQFSAPPFELLLLVSMSQRHGHVVPLLGLHLLHMLYQLPLLLLPLLLFFLQLLLSLSILVQAGVGVVHRDFPRSSSKAATQPLLHNHLRTDTHSLNLQASGSTKS